MVRTRIAPSPTGEDLHIGNLYTALINWAWARKNKGKFIVRIEDTDRRRYIKGAEKRILQTLKEFGLSYDESIDEEGDFGPYRQSERLDIYRRYAEKLIENGSAYYCFCSPERLSVLREKQRKEKKVPRYDRHCLQAYTLNQAKEKVRRGEKYVIRLKVPRGKEISFNDAVRGKITFNTDNIDDQVLMKSDGFPTYHLAVVIDDYLMRITHVIRAEEWISSTPKHVILYKAFGWDLPIFAHVPVLRNPDKSKLSKRKNPVWASWYLEQGYIPEAVLNYLSLMGWSHPQEKEIFSLSEYMQVFDLKDIKPVGPIFDVVKLRWMNGEYIRMMENKKLANKLFKFFKKQYPQDLIKKTVPLIKTRIKTLAEYDDLCRFLVERPKRYEKDLSQQQRLLQKILLSLEDIVSWKSENITDSMMQIIQKESIGVGKFFMILRVAISGKKITPPISESMEILGKDECLKRIKSALSG